MVTDKFIILPPKLFCQENGEMEITLVIFFDCIEFIVLLLSNFSCIILLPLDMVILKSYMRTLTPEKKKPKEAVNKNNNKPNQSNKSKKVMKTTFHDPFRYRMYIK